MKNKLIKKKLPRLGGLKGKGLQGKSEKGQYLKVYILIGVEFTQMFMFVR